MVVRERGERVRERGEREGRERGERERERGERERERGERGEREGGGSREGWWLRGGRSGCPALSLSVCESVSK